MAANPWYREPWPWLLMAGPAIVVVAGIATAVIAVVSFDGMVADDYYKQGLAVNRVIEREARARTLGIAADVQFSADRRRVRVVLDASPPPAGLRLRLAHPTLPGEDQSMALAPGAGGVYEGTLRAPRHGRMRLILEDSEGLWRLAGEWTTPLDSLRLEPR